jgi:hypothetical protein
MLNLVQTRASNFRLACTEIAGAFGVGVMLISTLIFWYDTNAKHKVAELTLHSPQDKVVQQSKQVQEAEEPISQAELAELKARVMFLSRRQVEREDFTDVQHILLKKRESQTSSTAPFQTLQFLQWRNGMLELDAISNSPADWRSLTNDLNQFDRWKTAPQVFQVHHGLSQVSFKLKAHLWANATHPASIAATNPATLPPGKSVP